MPQEIITMHVAYILRPLDINACSCLIQAKVHVNVMANYLNTCS